MSYDPTRDEPWSSEPTLTPAILAASEPYWRLATSVAMWRVLADAAPKYQDMWRRRGGPMPEELDLEEARQRVRDAWDLPPVAPRWHPAEQDEQQEWRRFDMSPDGIIALIDAHAALSAEDALRGVE